MPTNRLRRSRAWSGALEHYRAEMLRDGPEEMLLAGVGYMEGERCAVFDQLEGDDRSRVLLKMRADWTRHGAELVASWRAAGLASALQPSWAEREFGA
jgi:hypothetical protein